MVICYWLLALTDILLLFCRDSLTNNWQPVTPIIEPMIEQLYQTYLAHPSVTTDSRKVEEGQIFFALKGERFDGNQYAAEVLSKGAAAVVVDDGIVSSKYSIVALFAAVR